MSQSNEQPDNQSNKTTLVFWVSMSIIILITLLAGVFPSGFGKYANILYGWISNSTGWLFLIIVFVLDIFLIGLAITRFGRFKLGRDDEEPEFSFISWVGMLFSAGLGVGIVFWGVAEPMTHYLKSPLPNEVDGSTLESARLAMGYTFFHWGISQWSIFAMAGLIVAFFQFRKRRNGLISTAMEPVFGEAYKKPYRNVIDVLAIVATVMGIATSIGLGIMQIGGGLNHVFDIPNNNWTKIIITIIMTLIFLGSAASGLNKGVKWLSNSNIFICFALLVFILILGPTQFIFETFTVAIGDYITNFVQYSLRLNPYEGDNSWIQQWTVFYWAWVIAWSPFIGGFVARVSRGRTIREFVIGVLIIPPLISMSWIATFGGTAMYLVINKGASIAEDVKGDYTVALFSLLSHFPLYEFTSILAIILIFLFLVTSADSTTFILSSMSDRGSITPPFKYKLVWGILIGAISVAMTLAGGLESLQTASIVAGLPFAFILFMMIFSIMKALRREPTKHFKMTYIDDDTDFSKSLEEREDEENKK
ncbi:MULTISPECIES: BCCT family transporter [Mammaliicoccus]|jgi:glycine betaine transporter|uniref:BCCT family transporter n=1 Tax=Mammaliicoccus lentus TaxID=42858 RepID=A0AAP1RUB2_MAMLE|nr:MULTISPECIES: BCCT family transporter [Mammaliicoccus]HBV04893.1 BCCT family transporter [Staphylococcus sp.]MBF0748135.1 BCCT family transporter [Mammaliicoccus lentus]MBF0842906.1 BCCT family transporter [Mammaliicoccus lentus]MBU6113044.1 BCCT family transporter [Mammaliicoccus lentus]MBW0762132.1 BCCT family transporter [Mammaliicoccus lentus]